MNDTTTSNEPMEPLSPNPPIDLTTPLPPPQFVLDNEGNRIAAVLSIASYERLMDAFEELQDIAEAERIHDAIARGDEEVIPLDRAIAEIEASWVQREQRAA